MQDNDKGSQAPQSSVSSTAPTHTRQFPPTDPLELHAFETMLEWIFGVWMANGGFNVSLNQLFDLFGGYLQGRTFAEMRDQWVLFDAREENGGEQ